MTADHTRWDALAPLLRPEATVVAVDRRGRGGSGDAPTYAVAREFEDVAAVVDAFAAERGGPVDLFGHSFGGLVALEAATRSPNVRRVVLYEPVVLPPATPSDFAAEADALLAEGRRDAVVELFFRSFLAADDAAIAALGAEPSWPVRVAAAHTLPREVRAEEEFRFDPSRYREMRTPTLLLLGERTLEDLRRSTAAVASALPAARVATLSGQGHFAHAAAPKLVADVVLPFLAEDVA